MAHDVVQRQFGGDVQCGHLQWLELDYDRPEHEHYRQDYELVSSVVVVVRREHGRDVAWQRLDEVWDLVHDETAFRAYVRDAVQRSLAGN